MNMEKTKQLFAAAFIMLAFPFTIYAAQPKFLIVSFDPLEVETFKAGDTVELRLSLTSLVNSDSVAMFISLPDRVELVGGNAKWHGSMKKGEQIFLGATIRLSENFNRVVNATATVELKPGMIFGGHDSVLLGVSKQKQWKPGVMKKNRFGEKVMEFPAETLIEYK